MALAPAIRMAPGPRPRLLCMLACKASAVHREWQVHAGQLLALVLSEGLQLCLYTQGYRNHDRNMIRIRIRAQQMMLRELPIAHLPSSAWLALVNDVKTKLGTSAHVHCGMHNHVLEIEVLWIAQRTVHQCTWPCACAYM